MTARQKRILEFSPCWFNELREDMDIDDSANPALTKLHPLARVESDPGVLLPNMSPPHIRMTDENKAMLLSSSRDGASTG